MLESALTRISRPETDQRSVARGHCYLLGMLSRTDLLAEVIDAARRHADTGGAVGGGAGEWLMAAQWWHDRPGWARPIP